jgi:glycerophosphoryl diester phosphodiesterase
MWIRFNNKSNIYSIMYLKIGHRGAMGYETENTIRSFGKAIELGVDGVELDVHLCKTGEIVVIHDETVDRTTNGTGKVSDLTLDELKKLDAGKGELISTLKEVLDFIDKRVMVHIELKGEGTEEPVIEIINEYLKKGWKKEQFGVISFDHYKLLKFKGTGISVGPLLAGLPIGYADFAEKVHAGFISLAYRYINQRMIDDAHERGIKVVVWAVDDKDDVRKMADMGVDAICSNIPDIL